MRVAGAVGAVLWLAATAHGAEPQVVRKHLTSADAFMTRYVYVPFEVPPGTTRVEFEYAYDRANGANVVDLGLLEPGTLALGTTAFRGWTGGERTGGFVAVDDATPGYWPGPIPAGRWHVQLGLYKVGAAGVDVDVTVKTSRDPVGQTPALPARPAEPIAREARWYSGGLHAHTLHSDGKVTAAELGRLAREAGLDFLAITDHNNTAHQRERIDVPGLLVITGEEITTPGGHANVWGLSGERAFVDFRVLPGDPTLQQVVDQARAQGALVSINHPYADCYACTWTHAVPQDLDAIEISNPGAASIALAIGLWDSLLREGRRVTAVGASDWHRAGQQPIGTASVRVRADELSTRAILDAIRRRRVVVMADGQTPPPGFTVKAAGQTVGVGEEVSVGPGAALEVEVACDGAAYAGGRIDLVWRGEVVGQAPVPASGPVRFTRWANADGYLRVHVYTAAGAPLALTNPVFVALQGR
ncbi:MAG TPA: CehA/McbA family metallohydrolase [Vicinamibacteria bacterium]|nr:CehA/McbA family metallohydrolase [Vicinamibacteria bacterium]